VQFRQVDRLTVRSEAPREKCRGKTRYRTRVPQAGDVDARLDRAVTVGCPADEREGGVWRDAQQVATVIDDRPRDIVPEADPILDLLLAPCQLGLRAASRQWQVA